MTHSRTDRKYTPGPWRIERSGGGWVREIANGRGVAVCYGSIEDADAKLIAAAPDMLKALEAIERDSEDELTRDCARAAIKKARGE